VVQPRNPRQLPSRENKPERSLRAQALALLARREHSRQELERKLAPRTENPEEIPPLLDEFERRGWLSEARVVEQTVAARRARFGAAHIAHELRSKGVSEAAIAAAESQLKDSEVEAARAVWQKKFGAAPSNPREKARQMRFLQGRGFSFDVIRRVLSGDD